MVLYPLPGIYKKDTKDENVQKDGLLIAKDIRDGLWKLKTFTPSKDTPKTDFPKKKKPETLSQRRRRQRQPCRFPDAVCVAQGRIAEVRCSCRSWGFGVLQPGWEAPLDHSFSVWWLRPHVRCRILRYLRVGRILRWRPHQRSRARSFSKFGLSAAQTGSTARTVRAWVTTIFFMRKILI